MATDVPLVHKVNGNKVGLRLTLPHGLNDDMNLLRINSEAADVEGTPTYARHAPNAH